MEILRRTKEEEPVNPRRKNEAIDDDLVTVCLKCLEKDPAHRYVSAEALAEDLGRWLRREPIEARPVRIPGRVWRWCQREPILAAMTFGLIGLITVIALMTGSLYWREKKNRLKLEEKSEMELRALKSRIERDRERGDKALRISAQEVPVLLRERILFDGAEESMVLSAITPERNPDRMIQPFGYLLVDLQNKLRVQSGVRVRFDLWLYNRAEDLMEGLRDGAHLAWVDAAVYVQGRQRFQDLQPVVREMYRDRSTMMGAIVTRVDSGITNLAGLRGRSFAFGDKDSAMGWYLPKATLVRSGFSQKDLHTVTVPIARVISLVRSGSYDAGAVLEPDLERLRQAGGDLRVLATISCPSHPWVFTSRPEKPLFDAFRTGFLSLRDDTILGRLGNNVSGFIPADAAEYDQLEADIELAEQFDAP
jgi:ABC-type phosphate/phosphonate transport system substrate-binding protein